MRPSKIRMMSVVVGTLRRDDGCPERSLGLSGRARTHGVEVAWDALFIGSGARRVTLPTYAFQRKRYWLAAQAGAGDMASAGQGSADHPLLGAAVGMADDGGWLFTGRLSLQSHPWLADHAVMGCVLLPGTAFLELALHAGGQVGSAVVRELTLEVPLLFSEHGAVQLQLSVDERDEKGQRAVGIYSRPAGTSSAGLLSDEQWTRHAIGVLGGGCCFERPRAGEERACAAAWWGFLAAGGRKGCGCR